MGGAIAAATSGPGVTGGVGGTGDAGGSDPSGRREFLRRRGRPARGARPRLGLSQRVPVGLQRLSRWTWTADVFLAVFLAAFTVDSATRQYRFVDDIPRHPFDPGDGTVPPPPPPPDFVGQVGHLVSVSVPLWALVLAAATALPLAVRRRYPLAAFWVIFCATLAFHASDNPTEGTNSPTLFTFVSTLIAAYSVAVHGAKRRAQALTLALGTVLMLGFHQSTIPAISPGFVPFLLLVPAGLAANAVHTWRQRVKSMETEHEAATLRAVEQERARIARELHDVVTHNVSMMTVQAGAARKVMATSPDDAREALLAVEAGGRAALSELRHVMGLLTMGADPDDPADVELAPQPGLGQVGVLAGRIRDTGVPVELTVSGDPAPLPPGVDLAAYRVVQEALTNTVKHAVGAAVRISVEHARDEVRIEVADTGGSAAASAATGNGRGLIGLRERLAVYGGTLDAGRRISGGYRVRAVIPMGDV
jgi:signal transduction histidine kinase